MAYPAATMASPAAANVQSDSAWDYSLMDSEKCLIVSLCIPEGVEPADLDLDVGERRVLVSCQGATSELGPLTIELPQAVNAMEAPPAKYKKKGGRRLILELPLL